MATKRTYSKHKEKSAHQLRGEFITLLDEENSEQVYQNYIENNTRLVPREFVQNHGIHFQLVLRKLSFGADYKSDFAYLSKSSDDWNCVFIEIERPSARFFKLNSNQFHNDFLNALQQVNTWRAWLLDPTNKASLSNTTLGLIRKPLGRNPVNPKFVLVYGRRSEYGRNSARRSLVTAQERGDFKIITFDSLVENLQTKHDLYVGIRRNEYIDIVSDIFLDESIFGWMEPEHIRIGPRLKASAFASRGDWFHVREFKKEKKTFVMDVALGQVRIRPK